MGQGTVPRPNVIPFGIPNDGYFDELEEMLIQLFFIVSNMQQAKAYMGLYSISSADQKPNTQIEKRGVYRKG